MTTYNLGGNAIFLSCYAVLLHVQLYFGGRTKTWGFLFGMFAGCVLEIIGSTARVLMHFEEDQFLMCIVTLTIGPAFFSASIYLCLARIITVYGEKLSRFRPRTYTISFMVYDFIALVLQASGGAITQSSDPATVDKGLSIIQAGLSAHLVAMFAFVVLSLEFAWTAHRHRSQWDSRFLVLRLSRKFQAFLIALSIATLAIFIRTCFRVAELSQGFSSPLARNEAAFMVLEGAMVLIAVLALTICHPRDAFEGRWSEANFQLRKKSK